MQDLECDAVPLPAATGFACGLVGRGNASRDQHARRRQRPLHRIGATGDELQALYALVDVSEDFWKRQPGSLFIDAEAALSKARAEYKASQERRAA